MAHALTLLSAPLSTSCAQGRREQTSISSSSSKVLFELMQLPVHLLCEVLSYCPNASTANALTSTCKELRRLRSNPVAKALALVRHDFSSQDAAVYALRAFHMLCSPCGTDLLVAMVPANLEKVSGHLLHALVMMFTDGRNTAMLQKLLPLPRTQRGIDTACNGWTLLDHAVHFKRAEAVRLLLEQTADPRANGALCLWLASKSLEHSAVLPLLLLGRQFPPEAIDNALSHACAQSNVLACSTLLPLSSRAMEWNIMDGVRAAVDHGTLDILTLLAAYKNNKEDGTAPQHMAYGLGLAARIAHVPSASFLLWVPPPPSRPGHFHSAAGDGRATQAVRSTPVNGEDSRI